MWRRSRTPTIGPGRAQPSGASWTMQRATRLSFSGARLRIVGGSRAGSVRDPVGRRSALLPTPHPRHAVRQTRDAAQCRTDHCIEAVRRQAPQLVRISDSVVCDLLSSGGPRSASSRLTPRFRRSTGQIGVGKTPGGASLLRRSTSFCGATQAPTRRLGWLSAQPSFRARASALAFAASSSARSCASTDLSSRVWNLTSRPAVRARSIMPTSAVSRST